MVISDSKVNLTSKRFYNEAFSQGSFTTVKSGGSRIYSLLGNSFSSAYTMAEKHSNNSGRGHKSSSDFDSYTSGFSTSGFNAASSLGSF